MITRFIPLFLLFFIMKLSNCERRIIGGELIQYDRPYVVYLTKSNDSTKEYDEWICGGALVSPNLIVTSAACVEDVQRMYAIAGYRKYVDDANIDNDICTRHVKKKVIKSCRPKAYELDYNKVEKWTFVDIAVVTVESPYKFGDEGKKFFENCSYVPAIIAISYNRLYHRANTIVSMFGWGHNMTWRQVGDPKNYNQQTLNIAHSSIINKEVCKNKYRSSAPQILNTIERYMICTDGPPTMVMAQGVDGCDPENPVNLTETRRSGDKRNPGICQNDHGGPLVHRVDGVEVLIGVASVFRTDRNNVCTGPYLFTSTACISGFLNCLIKANLYRRNFYSVCNQPDTVRGYRLVEKYIDWSHKN